MSDPPPRWTKVRLAEVTQRIVDGSHNPPAKAEVGRPMLSARNIVDRRIMFRGHRLIAPDAFELEHRRTDIRAGDVLLTIVGAIGRTAVVPDGLEPFALQRSVAVIRPTPAALPDYLSLYFSSPDVQRWLDDNAKGTAQRGIYLKALSALQVSLPPLAEQRRIVAKLDQVMARTARVRAELARIPALIAHHKRAILAAAFRGTLCGAEPSSTSAGPWALPAGWSWVAFGHVVEIASNLVKPDEIPDLPHIAPDNIESKTARLLPYRTIQEDGVISPKHRFNRGQVLFSKIRPYLRKAVLVDFDGACSADMYPLNPSGQVNAKYLLYWLISEDFASFSFAHEGRSVLPKINQNGLNRTPFPLPPMQDQISITRRIEAAFVWLDNVAHEHAQAMRLLDHLDQALLAKAFRGELVPQDSADEPAAALLARIRAERLSPEAPARKRKIKA